MRFTNLFRRRRRDSDKDIATQRLQLVLSHDRANISPGMLEKLKDEIIAVISKHLEIESDQVRVNFQKNQRETRLVADIPLKRHTGRQKRI
ncbi:MAG: cell division topological specificity factor MinE [Anaerolineae bacterium]|nr:cell division topological specificity factor MinE [Anaerolineae bacterium]